MRKLLLFIILNVFAAGSLAETANDWFIVPGVRVGPITPGTTRSDLVRMFGAKNVVDDDVEVSDARPEPGTILFRERPEDSIAILWVEGEAGRQISSLIFCISQLPNVQIQKTCHWHTQNRITFGTTLKQLERMNGKPFHLLGFAWDYGGTMMSWDSGALEKSLTHSCGGLRLRANPDFGDKPSPAQIALMDQVSGDRSFSSAHPTMQSLNPKVDWISMGFAGCERGAK
jgi:hypothetical protein